MAEGNLARMLLQSDWATYAVTFINLPYSGFKGDSAYPGAKAINGSLLNPSSPSITTKPLLQKVIKKVKNTTANHKTTKVLHQTGWEACNTDIYQTLFKRAYTKRGTKRGNEGTGSRRRIHKTAANISQAISTASTWHKVVIRMATRAEVAIPCNFNGRSSGDGAGQRGVPGGGWTDTKAGTNRDYDIYWESHDTGNRVPLTDQENCCA